MSHISNLKDLSYFAKAPSDAYLILSDIRGSTEAIRKGKAKEVNMMGAAIISLISNITGEYNTISVFGGDGATALLSSNDFEKCKDSMVGLIHLAEKQFGLELRIGAVPIKTLNENTHELWIGKIQISETTFLAQMVGSGISFSEKLIKSNSPLAIHLNQINGSIKPPNLSGLSCRMNPFPSIHGRIVSAIIKAQEKHFEGWLRSELIEEIQKIIGSSWEEKSPVNQTNLVWKWIPKSILSEMRLHHFIKKWNFSTLLKVLIANFLIKLNINAGGFKPIKYKNEVPLHSDFIKYDDTLRFTLDLTIDQLKNIELVLEKHYKLGRIFYGLSESETALVTCFTKSASTGEHIHYVDGNDGGYTRASIPFKKQQKSNQS